MAKLFSEIFNPEPGKEAPGPLHPTLDKIAGAPMDAAFIKAVMSPDVREWYKYALGDTTPTVSETLLPWTRTGRFDQAKEMRTIFQHAIAGEMAKHASAMGMAPPSFEAAQQQNPAAYQLSGIQPPMGQNVYTPPPLEQIQGAEAAGLPSGLIPRSPVATSEYPQIGAPLQPAQAQAYMQSVAHVPTALAQLAKDTTKGQIPLLQERRNHLEAQLAQFPGGHPTLEREIQEVQGAIDLATTSQKEGIQPNKVALSLFPGAKSYDALKSSLVTPDDEARLARLSQMTGMPLVAKVGMTKQEAVDATLYQRQVAIAGAAAGAAATGKQAATLVQPGVRSDLFERGPFFKTGELKNAPSGITETQAAKGNYIQLSDKQRADLAHTEQAGIQLDQIFGMSDKLITASSGFDAWKQALKLTTGAMSRTNPTAKVYQDSLQALSNSLSRSLGGERGVLTNVDVIRWVNAMPKFSDTAAIKDQKQKLIKLIYQTSVDAQRRALAGDDVTARKTELSRMLDRLTNLDEEGDRTMRLERSKPP